MTTRRTFLQRLGIGIAGGAIVAKAATETRIPATGPTTRLAEPEPRQIPISREMADDALWFETTTPTRPMMVQYWMPATTAIPLGGAFLTRGPTDLTIGDGAREHITPTLPGCYCSVCREPLPLGASYCIYCAAEVA